MGSSLSDRFAVVTGGTKGIGFAIAKDLASHGARVAICARNTAELTVTDPIFTESSKILLIPVDLSKIGAGAQIVEKILSQWGGLDILVNNAGGLPSTGNFEELSDSDWNDSFQLNLMSVVRLCRHALPVLRKSKCGRIINISSFVAMQPGGFNPHYSAMKLALVNLSKHLSNYLAKDQVTVNCISPGNVDTEGWADYIKNKAADEAKDIKMVEEEENRRVADSIPLGRFAQSNEIASMVRFLASDDASYITGENITIDGGKTRSV
jgi:NAD(P)-dependent dehydrogenase (short-subunit alcohol dehydrogenase family)